MINGTKQDLKLLRGWIIASAAALAAAMGIVVYCILSGQFDFEPIVRPTPTGDGITYEESIEEI